jgi:antitoxin (DNA-binding transcriptional repressor) of toxin-antitoxin stability system
MISCEGEGRRRCEAISVAEAKQHFEEMLEYVRAGETVALTDNGATVAELHRKDVDRRALVQRLGKDLAESRSRVKPVAHDDIVEWHRIGLK